jgi:hypothetical protein
MLGIAIRNNIYLNLNLPDLFWKQLLDIPLSIQDLEVLLFSVSFAVCLLLLSFSFPEHRLTIRNPHFWPQIRREIEGPARRNGRRIVDATLQVRLWFPFRCFPCSHFSCLVSIENFTGTLSDGVSVVELVPNGLQVCFCFGESLLVLSFSFVFALETVDVSKPLGMGCSLYSAKAS